MKKIETIRNKNWVYVGEVKNGKPHGKGKGLGVIKLQNMKDNS